MEMLFIAKEIVFPVAASFRFPAPYGLVAKWAHLFTS